MVSRSAIANIAKRETYRMNGSIAQEMEDLLTERFTPTKLEIIKDSAHHGGHTRDVGERVHAVAIKANAPA